MGLLPFAVGKLCGGNDRRARMPRNSTDGRRLLDVQISAALVCRAVFSMQPASEVAQPDFVAEATLRAFHRPQPA